MLVTIDSVLSRRAAGVILSGTVTSPGHVLDGRRLRIRARLAGVAGSPGPGEAWEVDGDLVETAWGAQIEARHIRRRKPEGRLLTGFLANHVPGIGEQRAKRLWTAFGLDLGDILSSPGEIPRIADAIDPDRSLLSLRLAAACVEAWRGVREEGDLLTWLESIGVDDLGVARRVARILGPAARGRLSENPYTLVPLVPWERLDKVALRVFADGDVEEPSGDVRRLVGAGDEAAKHILKRGDTAVACDDLRNLVGRVLGSPDLVGPAMAAIERNAAMLPGPKVWRVPGAAAMEDDLARRLRALIAAGRRNRFSTLTPSKLAEAIADASDPLRPLHWQQAAVVGEVLGRPIACLTGGAGVGKTYVCRVVCDAWERAGGDVLLCALAGKAALRLSRSTGRLARTIARTVAELQEREAIFERIGDTDLGENERVKLEARRGNLPEVTSRTLLLVDEASMVDLPSMHALVRYLPERAHLLLVGDPAQLPPCGFGLVFHHLVEDPSITSSLTHVHRQSASTGIPSAAAALRQRRLPDWTPYEGRGVGVSFVACRPAEIAGVVDRIVGELSDAEEPVLVVTATKAGRAGVAAINGMLHERYVEGSGASSMQGAFGRSFAEGEPVIFGRNDYRMGLFNGLMGRITALAPDAGEIEVAFDGEGAPKRLGADQLVDLDLAYAVTCHKCQGSSAARVVIPVYRTRVLDPSWLYTAVTRAEYQVVLVGDPEALAEALSRPFAADERVIGFEWEGRE